MSLHALANHMAAQGRNGDSMLVHMTPKEVGGLHALAIANGGQLTINPDTGLPEASFLGDLLPAVLGFGLDTFLPGLGEAVGGAFGLSAAAGTGIAVGGLTGLATGSLSKGVMAGFGAYGGAGLAEGLMGAGADAATKTAAAQLQGANETAAAGLGEYANPRDVMMARTAPEIAKLSPMEKLTAGFSASTQNPSALLDFGKNNWKYGIAAAAPALMGGFSGEDQTVTKMPSTGMINPFIMNRKQLARDESLSPSAQQKYLSYGVTPITPVHAANGGAVQHFRMGGVNSDDYDEYGYLKGSDAARRATPVWNKFTEPPPNDGVGAPLPPAPPGGGGSFGREPGNTYGSSPGGVAGTDGFGDGMRGNGVGTTDPYTQQFLDKAKTYQNTMTGDSASAFDYLMGNTRPTAQTTGRTGGANPRGTVRPPVGMQKPAVPASTEGIQALADIVRGGGGNTRSEPNGYVSNYAPDVNSYSNGLVHALLNPVANNAPVVDIGTASGFTSVAQAESAQNQALANQYAQYRTLQQAQAEQAQQDAAVSTPVTYGTITTSGLPSNDNYSNEGRNSDGFTGSGAAAGSSTSPAAGTTNGGESGGWGSRDAGGGGDGGDGGGDGGGGGGGDARGGFLNNGRFDQRYAYGGGIAALSDGGLGSLGGYSDGGRLLRGPGDGVSDSIPATIGEKQPARLADGEFVVPARIVSELGNGSTEAGARQLYAMMDRIQSGRKKTVGKNKVAANTRAAKHLPA